MVLVQWSVGFPVQDNMIGASHPLMGSPYGVTDFFSPSAAENSILRGQKQ